MPVKKGEQECSDDELKSALSDSHGLLKTTARFLAMDRSSLFQRIQRNPDLKEFQKILREDANDDVQGSLYDMATSRKNVAATTYWLSHLATDRGFNDTHTIKLERPDDENIDLNLLTDEEILKYDELQKKATKNRDLPSST